MFFRSILLSVLFISPLTASADDGFADLDPDIEAELQEIHNAPTHEKATNERRDASFNALDEEEEFEMDMTGIAKAAPVIDPDAELEPLVINNTTSDIDGPEEMNDIGGDLGTFEEIEEAPTPVDPGAQKIEWNLDLDEDIEIGNKTIQIKEEAKSAPVDLDFLDEE
jgi:hypothetical protein